MNFEILEVGKPYPRKIPEGCLVEAEEGGFILLYGLPSPSAAEIEALRFGRLRIGVVEFNNFVCFVHSFDGFPTYSDSPFSIRAYDGYGIDFPWLWEPLAPGIGYALRIMLVDTNTGILQSLRLVGLHHDLSVKLQKSLRDQKEKPFSMADYDQSVGQIYARYESKDLAKLARIYKIG
jgi:hypothetical protein